MAAPLPPEGPRQWQAPPATPESKVKKFADFAEVATLAMQAICILDDIDDKLDEQPQLLADMGLSREEVSRSLRFLRKLSDKARAT